MREIFQGIVGNRLLKERLAPKLAAEALPHALILEGAPGTGKHLLARELAMAISCEHRLDESHPLPCGGCRSCRKLGEGLSPDLITVKKQDGKATMGVEVVRLLKEGVRAVPNDLERKFYIIEDADTMTVQAQNALLLTLEEPPRFVMFLLLVQDAGALLETIRSRAPIYRMQPVEDAELRDHLTRALPEAAALFRNAPEEAEAILKLAGGSIGSAVKLFDAAARAPKLLSREHATEICRLLADRTAGAALLMRILSLPTAREELNAVLETLREALRDLILLSRTEHAPLIFYTERESAAELSVRFTTERLLAAFDATTDATEALAANANTRLTLIRLYDRLTAL